MLLVTGAAGFLGSALVKLLWEEGRPVRAMVRREPKPGVLPAGVPVAFGDLADGDSLAEAMRGCEGVFHLAAALGATPEEARRANVDGTARVLAAAARAGVRRLVHTSTSAAIVDPSGLVSEQAPNRTGLTDPYSTTKAEAEGLVFAAAEDGFDACMVNVVGAYGPSPAGAASYNSLFLAAARGEVDEIVDAPMGWVTAADVARGQLLALDRGAAGRRYLLCGEVVGFAQVLNRFAELMDSPHRVAARPPGTTLPGGAHPFARRSEVYGRLGPLQVDDAQARGLGFRGLGVEDGLTLTARWLAQPDRP